MIEPTLVVRIREKLWKWWEEKKKERAV